LVFFNRLSITLNRRRERAFSAWSAESFPIDFRALTRRQAAAPLGHL
jgi:hypothetical protein